MNERASRVQRSRAWLLALVVSGVTTAQGARADEPAPAALAAARELFREATQDADAGRHEAALEKFRRVAATKETGPVRFNIAKCEHALGRLGAALADYELAEREAHQEKKTDIAKLAKQQAAALRPRVPRLVLVAPSPPPKDLAVSLDGEKIPTGSLGAALPVDPGTHRVEASAPGHTVFKKEVALKEREEQRVTVELTAEPGLARPEDSPEMKLALEAPPPPPPSTASAREHSEQPPPAESGASRRTWGFVTLGIGAALGITSIVVWRVHESKVSELAAECPGGRCPTSTSPQRQSELRSLEDGAKTTSTVATLLAVGAGVAIVAGTALVLWPAKKPDATLVVPLVGPGVAGAALKAAF